MNKRNPFDDCWRECASGHRSRRDGFRAYWLSIVDRVWVSVPSWLLAPFMYAFALCLLVFRVVVYCLICLAVYLGLACLAC